MSQLLETIKCENGKLFHLEFHNQRLNHSRNELFGISQKIDLQKTVIIPETCKNGLFRCRVLYSKEIEKIEFLPYQFRKITTIKLIENNNIDYHLKFSDRESLQQLFNKRGICDDILIVKKGCITDSFAANPVFFDCENWWTPDTPLLPGTQRARLISEAKLQVCRITPNDISKYSKMGLINALNDLENMPVIEINNIHF